MVKRTRACHCCGAKTKLYLSYSGQASPDVWLCKDEAACVARLMKVSPTGRLLDLRGPELQNMPGKRDQARRFK